MRLVSNPGRRATTISPGFAGSEIDGVVAWRSNPVTGSGRATMDAASAAFTGPMAGHDQLAAYMKYRGRVRSGEPEGKGGGWSPWLQVFRTGGEQRNRRH